MNDLAAGKARLVVVGATGMVGGYALRYALNHPSVGVVTVIGRRKLDISHPKLNTGTTAAHGTRMYYSMSCSRQLRSV